MLFYSKDGFLTNQLFPHKSFPECYLPFPFLHYQQETSSHLLPGYVLSQVRRRNRHRYRWWVSPHRLLLESQWNELPPWLSPTRTASGLEEGMVFNLQTQHWMDWHDNDRALFVQYKLMMEINSNIVTIQYNFLTSDLFWQDPKHAIDGKNLILSGR